MTSLLYKFLREQINKFPTKRIFRILDILKTSRKTTFCNLFIERPSYIKLSHFPSVLICLHVVVLNEIKNNAVAYPPSRLRKTQRGAMNPPCPHTEIATTLSFSGRLGRRHDWRLRSACFARSQRTTYVNRSTCANGEAMLHFWQMSNLLLVHGNS